MGDFCLYLLSGALLHADKLLTCLPGVPDTVLYCLSSHHLNFSWISSCQMTSRMTTFASNQPCFLHFYYGASPSTRSCISHPRDWHSQGIDTISGLATIVCPFLLHVTTLPGYIPMAVSNTFLCLLKKIAFICEFTRSIIFYFETNKIMLKWFEMGEITKKKIA